MQSESKNLNWIFICFKLNFVPMNFEKMVDSIQFHKFLEKYTFKTFHLLTQFKNKIFKLFLFHFNKGQIFFCFKSYLQCLGLIISLILENLE